MTEENPTRGINPDCEKCGGSGFIKLWDFDGPGLHDEDNCPCTEDVCDCGPCVRRRESDPVREFSAAIDEAIEQTRNMPDPHRYHMLCVKLRSRQSAFSTQP